MTLITLFLTKFPPYQLYLISFFPLAPARPLANGHEAVSRTPKLHNSMLGAGMARLNKGNENKTNINSLLNGTVYERSHY